MDPGYERYTDKQDIYLRYTAVFLPLCYHATCGCANKSRHRNGRHAIVVTLSSWPWGTMESVSSMAEDDRGPLSVYHLCQRVAESLG